MHWKPAIHGLRVTTAEYEEVKPIWWCTQTTANLPDQLEQVPSIRSNNIHAREEFVDPARIMVVKLQAEGKDGELGDGV